jgi:hypothetical protein
MIAAFIGRRVVAILFVSLKHALCVSNDPAQLCDDYGPHFGGFNTSCSRAHQAAEQAQQTFSFNQCVGLNYDFSSFFRQVCFLILPQLLFLPIPFNPLQDYYVHYSMQRSPNPVRFSRNRVCALHNVISLL